MSEPNGWGAGGVLNHDAFGGLIIRNISSPKGVTQDWMENVKMTKQMQRKYKGIRKGFVKANVKGNVQEHNGNIKEIQWKLPFQNFAFP